MRLRSDCARKIIALMVCSLLLIGSAAAEMIYAVSISLGGMELVSLVADEKPTIADRLVIVRSEGVTYYTSLGNVVIMEIDTRTLQD